MYFNKLDVRQNTRVRTRKQKKIKKVMKVRGRPVGHDATGETSLALKQ